MSTRRSKRSAATAAENKIQRVIDDIDSDEESNTSTYRDSSRRPSSAEESASSAHEGSDDDFEENVPLRATKGKKNKKTVVAKKQRAKVVEPPANSSSSENSTPAPKSPESVAVEEAPSENNSEYKDLNDTALKSLMRSFRLTDLQALMIFVGKNKAGRKTELMDRASELVDKTNGDTKKRLSEKIQELSTAMYKSISSAPSVNPYSSTYQPPNETNTTASNNSQEAPPNTNFGGIPPLNLSANGNGNVPVQPLAPAPRYDSYDSYHYKNPYASHLMYPTYPDVKLRNLPFFKIEGVLMKPSSLQPKGLARFQEQTFSFHLTPTQASECNRSQYRTASGRSEFKQQIQLRFSLLETSCEQDDNFPSSVCVKVNGRLQTLPNPIPTNKPGVEPKRPPKPIDITSLCKLSSTAANFINVTWAVEVGSGYTVSVYFVDKLSSTDLMDELKKKGKRHSDYTRALIKDKLSDKDNEIATTSCKVSLACPLGKMRMTTPCRSSTCDHLQCFDASLYLMMNEKKPKWVCPVCNKPALYENLLIDGYFTDVLTSKQLPHDEHEIVLQSDASWESLVPAKTKTENNADEKPAKRPTSPAQDRIKKQENVETLSLDDDDDEISVEPSTSRSLPTISTDKSTKSKEVDYVTLDSDDDEAMIVPPAGKRRRIEDDSDSLSVSALTPTSVTPPPFQASGSYDNSSLGPMLSGNQSPEIICLDDD